MIDLDRIKQTVDLVELIRSRGVELTKNGKGYKGRCPFHEDNDPSFSVNPSKNLWHCFRKKGTHLFSPTVPVMIETIESVPGSDPFYAEMLFQGRLRRRR